MKREIFKLPRPGKFLAVLTLVLFFPVLAFAQWSAGGYAGYGLPVGSLYSIIRGVMLWLLAIFGFFAVIGFIISGIMYLTASGDDEQQKKAKKQMYWSIIGVIVGLIGLIVIYAVDRMLNANYYYF